MHREFTPFLHAYSPVIFQYICVKYSLPNVTYQCCLQCIHIAQPMLVLAPNSPLQSRDILLCDITVSGGYLPMQPRSLLTVVAGRLMAVSAVSCGAVSAEESGGCATPLRSTGLTVAATRAGAAAERERGRGGGRAGREGARGGRAGRGGAGGKRGQSRGEEQDGTERGGGRAGRGELEGRAGRYGAGGKRGQSRGEEQDRTEREGKLARGGGSDVSRNSPRGFKSLRRPA